MGELYVQYEYWVAAFQLVFAMFGMGATLTLNDFKDVVKEPRAVTIGLMVQLVAVPLAAYLFIHGFGVVGGVAVGLALIAAIPGGTTSNIFTHFAKGNIPLSISITGLTTLACLVTTPLILSILISEYLPSDFSMPTAQIVGDIAFTLLLPLALGMFVLKLLPRSAANVSKWSIRASLFGILMIVVGSSSAGRLDIDAFGLHNVGMVVLFLVLMWLAVSILNRALNLSRPDRSAIEMEVVVRNVNLGVLIKASLFPAAAADPMGDLVLFAVLLYGAVQMIVAAGLIYWRRREKPQ